MAEQITPTTQLVNINNRSTDATNTPTTIAANMQVVDARIVADDRMTTPGVQV